MAAADCDERAERPGRAAASAATARRDARLRQLFEGHFAFVWRYLRRLGLSEPDADDAAQKVFLVLSRKLGAVEPGKERAFLCGTATRVASEHRRSLARRREVAAEDAGIEPAPSSQHQPDRALSRQQARALLDEVLGAMAVDLRSVFVLFELEETSTQEIAALLDLPVGTVASRLRRARESFRAIVKRMRASGTIPGGVR